MLNKNIQKKNRKKKRKEEMRHDFGTKGVLSSVKCLFRGPVGFTLFSMAQKPQSFLFCKSWAMYNTIAYSSSALLLRLLKMLRLKRLTSLRPAITVNSRVFFSDEEDRLKLFSLIPSHHPSHLISNRFFDFYQVFQSSLFLFCLDPMLIKEFKHKNL